MTACQRWRNRVHSWRHVGDGGFDARRYDVALAPAADVRTFVTGHHYSGSWPAASHTLGLFEREELVGAAVFGVPVRREVLTGPFPDLVPYIESLELSRFVLLDRVPGNAETWFLGRAFRYLRVATEVRGVLAFSDPIPRRAGETVIMPGHWGTIYQAANARYLGRGRARRLTLLPDGTVLNDRALAKLRHGERGWRYVADRLVALGAPPPRSSGPPDVAWVDTALLRSGARWSRHGGNLRYAFPLHRSVRVGLPVEPYPKRDELGGLVSA